MLNSIKYLIQFFDKDFILDDIVILNRDDFKNSREYIYNTIKYNIINLILKPGDRINEPIIVEKLNVSRTPIREGIIRLVSDGLVTIIPQVSSYVSKISIKSMRDDTFVRTVIEEKIMDIAIDMMRPEDIERAKNILREQYETIQSGDIYKNLLLDNMFHKLFLEVAGNHSALSIVTNIYEKHQRERLIYIQDNSNLKEIHEEHLELLKCVEKKDRDSAKILLNQHIFHFTNSIDKIRSLYPHYME